MKNTKMQKLLFFSCLFFIVNTATAQFGYGLTFTNDIYQRYTNAQDVEDYNSAGSAILNLGLGPKIWVGGQDFSVSLETQANLGVLGLAVKDYKGLGMVGFPILAKLNFKGISGLDKEGRLGFSIGGGVQYSRTELYGLSGDSSRAGITRALDLTYIGQFGYGFGLSGFGVQGILKYGYNPNTNAKVMAIGLQWDFNIPMLKKITNSSSSL